MQKKPGDVVDRDPRKAALAGIELFSILKPNERDALLAGAAMRRYERNVVVMRRGEEATGMMIVLQGKLRVSVVSQEGQEVALGMLGPGDVLGEMALLDGGTRSADVNVVEEYKDERRKELELDSKIPIQGGLARRKRFVTYYLGGWVGKRTWRKASKRRGATLSLSWGDLQ